VAANQDRSPRDVEIYFSPFFHVSLATGLLTGLSAGGSVDVLRCFDAEAALAAIRRGGTRLMGSPTMFVALRQSPSFARTDRSGVTHVAFGATDATKPFVDALLGDFPNARLYYGYGATEYGPVTALPHEEMGSRTGVGRAVAGVELQVVGGEPGELAVRCPWQAEGYWGRPEETAATFTDQGIMLGDVASIDADGWVVLSGRSKEMVITGGENVFPIEVENVLALHPAVSEVCVFGVPDDYWGERVEAAVVVRPGTTLDADDLVAFARTRLAGYKVPKGVHELPALPLTPNNKPDRRALRSAWTGGGQNLREGG
jgi:fatty-acyl-CoA synthase